MSYKLPKIYIASISENALLSCFSALDINVHYYSASMSLHGLNFVFWLPRKEYGMACI